MNKKQIICISTIAVIVMISAIFMIKRMILSKFQTEPVSRQTITQIVEASGTINPENTVSIGSTVSGLMMQVFVDYNSEVKKGQQLAQLDTSCFQADVDKALANLNQAKAAYEKQQAVTENDKRNYERYKNLYARNFVSKSELDDKETTYKSDLAQLDSLRGAINAAEATYKYNKNILSFASIYSPIDGTIIKRNIDPGQPVAASFQAPELFLVAKNLKEMQIEVSVSEADIGKIRKGQEVEYTLDGYPNETFTGEVSVVRLASTNVSNVVTYTVIVKVNNDDMKLKPGMTANVSIITSKKENVVCVPNIALKYVPTEKGKEIIRYNNQGVWVLNSGKPERVVVKLGASNDSYTEVLSGLNEGDKVIVGITSNNRKNNKTQKRPPMRMF